MRPLDQPRWDRAYAEFRAFVAAYGHGTIPKNYVSDSGLALGKWVTNQRDLASKDRLLASRLQVLDSDPSWIWSTRSSGWTTAYRLLSDFVATHGRLPYQSESYQGVALGVWVRTQRRAYREGRMTPERSSLLAATPGWLWVADEC